MSLRPISFHCARTIWDSVATALGASFFCAESCGRAARAAEYAGAKAAKRDSNAAPSTRFEIQDLRFIDDLPGRPGWRTVVNSSALTYSDLARLLPKEDHDFRGR